MEFDIDIIPDDTLHEMLKIIRKYLPPLVQEEPEAPPAPARSHSMSKPKKNKPMSKHEQEDRISRLQAQIESFQKEGVNSQSPDGQDGRDSSGDDSDSGSESEEE